MSSQASPWGTPSRTTSDMKGTGTGLWAEGGREPFDNCLPLLPPGEEFSQSGGVWEISSQCVKGNNPGEKCDHKKPCQTCDYCRQCINTHDNHMLCPSPRAHANYDNLNYIHDLEGGGGYMGGDCEPRGDGNMGVWTNLPPGSARRRRLQANRVAEVAYVARS